MPEDSVLGVPNPKWGLEPHQEHTHHLYDRLDTLMSVEESTSPVLSNSMEELVDLDQLLAELSAPLDRPQLDMEHCLPNNYPVKLEKKTVTESKDLLTEDHIAYDAWGLLDELEGLNNNLPNSPNVETVQEFNPSSTPNMDYFQNPDFYNLPLINDTLRELQTAPDSADCTIVHNPLIKYILENEKKSSGNGSNRDKNCSWMINSQDKTFQEDERIVLKTGTNKINEGETDLLLEEQNVYNNNNELNEMTDPVFHSVDNMCIDFNENNFIEADNLKNDCNINNEPISPFLLPNENSVCIESLLSSSSINTLQQQTQSVTLEKSKESQLQLILNAAGISSDQYSTVKIIEPVDNGQGEPIYTIILDADDDEDQQPLPSVSPALSIASSASSRQTNRKRTATGDSCRSVLSNTSSWDHSYDSAVPSTSRTDSDSPKPKSRKIKSEDEEYEDRYGDMRKKNNEASRRSRQNRRDREKEMEKEVTRLTEENKELKQKVDVLETLVKTVKQTVIEAIGKRVR